MCSSYQKNLKFNFVFGFRHPFSWLTPLKLKNVNQKLKISNNTQTFAQRSSWKCLINTSLPHTTKTKLFFVFRNSFRWQTPLKFNNYDQKLKISNNNKNFAQRSSWESLINTSLQNAMKIKDFNFFFGFRPFFSWANTFKTYEFRP